MEMLNYSLWFTLIWWVFNTYYIFKEVKEETLSEFAISYSRFPAIAILLEYLIVRQKMIELIISYGLPIAFLVVILAVLVSKNERKWCKKIKY